MKITFSNHKKLYKEVFASDAAKKVLHELCDKFYLLRPTVREKGDPDMMLREGMRQVVLYILSQVEYDLESYFANRHQHKMEVTHDD